MMVMTVFVIVTVIVTKTVTVMVTVMVMVMVMLQLLRSCEGKVDEKFKSKVEETFNLYIFLVCPSRKSSDSRLAGE
jgi:hypothetical protein